MAWLKLRADDLLAEFGYYAVDMANFRNSLLWAGEAIGDEAFGLAEAHLTNAHNSLGYALKHLTGAPPWGYGCSYQIRDILYWIEDNWPTDGDEYVLTATKICEAWAKDGFHDRALTIAFIDRMRQLVWDEPFYVAWAARPKV